MTIRALTSSMYLAWAFWALMWLISFHALYLYLACREHHALILMNHPQRRSDHTSRANMPGWAGVWSLPRLKYL